METPEMEGRSRAVRIAARAMLLSPVDAVFAAGQRGMAGTEG